jgi:hypothetical protein
VSTWRYRRETRRLLERRAHRIRAGAWPWRAVRSIRHCHQAFKEHEADHGLQRESQSASPGTRGESPEIAARAIQTTAPLWACRLPVGAGRCTRRAGMSGRVLRERLLLPLRPGAAPRDASSATRWLGCLVPILGVPRCHGSTPGGPGSGILGSSGGPGARWPVNPGSARHDEGVPGDTPDGKGSDPRIRHPPPKRRCPYP